MIPQDLAAAIRAAPDDDAPRLAAAAHLSPERAELVRVQCALARLAPDDPQRDALAIAERNLLEANAAPWTESWRALAKEVRFVRGFVEEAELRASHFLPEALTALLRSEPALTSLHLDLVDQDAAWPELAAVLRSGLLAGVRRLVVERPRHERSHTDRERGPGENNNFRIGPTTLVTEEDGEKLLDALLAAPAPWPLRELVLEEAILPNRSIFALCRWHAVGSLERLALRHADLGSDATESLCAAGESFAALRDLDLSGNTIDGTMTQLSRAPFPKLETLRLSGTRLSLEGLRTLVRTRELPALVDLGLGDNGFNNAAAEAIAGASRLSRLSRLSLAQNEIHDPGAEALAASPHLQGLAQLDLRNNSISEFGQKRLRDRFGDRVRLDHQGRSSLA